MQIFSFTFLTVGSVLLLNTSWGTKPCMYYLLIGQKYFEVSPCKIVLPLVFFSWTAVRDRYNILVHNSQILVRNCYNIVGQYYFRLNFSPFRLHIFWHPILPYEERENNRARKMVCINQEGGMWDLVTEQSWRNINTMHPAIRGHAFWLGGGLIEPLKIPRFQSFPILLKLFI